MLAIGSTFGRYRIEAALGSGGMGEIYRAHDSVLKREIALKTLRDSLLATDGGRRDTEAEARFLREARATAALRHPAVVTVFDVGVIDGVPFIAMDLVEGARLSDSIGDGSVALATRLGWLTDIADALAEAHASGLVHRDIKPHNVMITTAREVKVLDFGLAVRAERSDGAPVTFQTEDGRILGTREYMAPERFRGADRDPSIDQFGWGVLAYELLSGVHPARAAGLPAGCPAAAAESPPRLNVLVPDIEESVAKIVAKAMALDPSARFPDMRALCRALRSALSPGDSTEGARTWSSRAGDAAPLGGRYVIEGELGRGGAAVVYRARDVKADEWVALKLLRIDHGSEERLDRFRRELRLARKVTHPNVVRIFDLVELPGQLGLSMELVTGESLDRRLARGALELEALERLALDVAGALAAAHRAGVVHRDLKPGNVLLRASDGAAMIADFGISRAFESDGTTPASTPSGITSDLVAGRALVGTPLYMAPEQLEGKLDVGPAADVYAFGLLMREAATGAHPKVEIRSIEELSNARRSPWPSLSAERPDLPATLCNIVDRALAPQARDRWPSGVELAAALSPAASAQQGTTPATPVGRTFGISAGHTPRRTVRSIGATLTIATIAGSWIVGWPWSRKPDGAASDPSRTAATSLAVSASPDPPSRDALAAYTEGMQALRDGAGDVGPSFARAIKLDPMMAEAFLRRAILSLEADPIGAREDYKRANELRSRLNARDLGLLAAAEPYVARSPSDEKEWAARLRELIRRNPGDAELHFYLGVALMDLGELRDAKVAAEEGLAGDPGFTGLVPILADSEDYLGDFDGSLRTLDRLPGASIPGAAIRLRIYEQRGECQKMADHARSVLAANPTAPFAHRYLGEAMFALGSPVGAVRATLEQEVPTIDPTSDRPKFREGVTFRLAAAAGDFAGAEAAARRLTDLAKDDGEVFWHAASLDALLSLYAETARPELANAAALEFSSKKEAWAPESRAEDRAIAQDPTPRILAAERRSGTLSRAAFVAKRDEWLAEWERKTPTFYRPWLWVHGYAGTVETPEDAREAIEALPRYGEVPPYRPEEQPGVDVGWVFFLADRLSEALPLLASGAGTCAFYQRPFAETVAHYHYGRGLEADGQVAAACVQYDTVLGRWGTSRPRSVTAEDARKRAGALHCRGRGGKQSP